MHILIVANQTLKSDELVAAAMARNAEGPCEFRVLVPATPLSKQEAALRHSEHPGDPDPFTAIRTVMEHRTVDEVIISTLPRRLSRWLASDLPTKVNRRLGVKTTHVETGRVLGPVEHGGRHRAAPPQVGTGRPQRG